MMCITGIDEGIDSTNLGVVYNLHSMKYNHKIEIYIPVDKNDPKIFSVEKIWRMAEWFEREIYDMYGLTAAHKTLPLNTVARVTNLENGKSLILRINDRGPYIQGRMLDCSNQFT